MSKWRDRVIHRMRCAFDGGRLLLAHENAALLNLKQSIHERVAVAKSSRRWTESLRLQWDLTADTRLRLQQDHQLRRQLIRGMCTDMIESPR